MKTGDFIRFCEYHYSDEIDSFPDPAPEQAEKMLKWFKHNFPDYRKIRDSEEMDFTKIQILPYLKAKRVFPEYII